MIPIKAIADMGSIVRNVVQLTAMLKANRTPAKADTAGHAGDGPELVNAIRGTSGLTDHDR